MAENDGGQPQNPASPGSGSPTHASTNLEHQALTGQTSAPERPGYVPEKFWNADKGEVRWEDLGTSYTNLEKLVGRKTEDARRDAEIAIFGKRPESADKYEITKPIATDGLVVLLEPPGPDFKPEAGKQYAVLNPSDPVFQIGREMAYRAGLSQDEFAEMVGQYATLRAQSAPTAEQLAATRAQFYGELGEHGKDRAQFVWNKARGLLGERADALDAMVTDRAGFEAIEALVTRASGATFAPSTSGGPASSMTEAELRQMVADPRYKTDEAFRRRVTEGFDRLYGAQPAGVPAPFARTG